VSNKHEAHSRANTWEQVITVAVTLVASIVAMVAGAPDKWLAAIFCTVVTFGGIISFFKEKWKTGDRRKVTLKKPDANDETSCQRASRLVDPKGCRCVG
jgi:cation transport ATPase